MSYPGGRALLSAEWALWGKNANDTEYRLLSSSRGVFSKEDLAFAIDRYSPGTLEIRALPQVTVSWLKHPGTGQPSHLGLAIHETAGDDSLRDGPGRSRFDAAGREIVYVRYFCVPYEELARHAVSYQQFYETFRRLPLPGHDDGPITADLAGLGEQPSARADDRFARHVAAQLLSTRPVCITGAQDVPFEERLRFLDMVLSWLPYGARGQLSAATSVNNNFTAHKHRLFFASVPRDETGSDGRPAPARRPSGRPSGRPTGRKRDITIEWGRLASGQPGQPGQPGQNAAVSVDWNELGRLRDQGVLAGYVDQVDLNNEHLIRAVLDQLPLHGQAEYPQAGYGQAGYGQAGWLTTPDTPPDGYRYPGQERTRADDAHPLHDDHPRYEDYPQHGDHPLHEDNPRYDDHLRYIERLKAKGAWPLTTQTPERRRALVVAHNLLNGDRCSAIWRDQYYDLLLDTVLDGPATYADYLWVVDSTDSPPDGFLLRALERRLTDVDVPWLLIQRALGKDLAHEIRMRSASPRWLDERLATRLVEDAVRGMTADQARGGAGNDPPLRPEHGRMLFDPVVKSLLAPGRIDRDEVKRLGYLGPALDRYFAGDEPGQEQRAIDILRNVYGWHLGKNDIKEVFRGSEYVPADALLAAVIKLAASRHRKFAENEFARARTLAKRAGPSRTGKGPRPGAGSVARRLPFRMTPLRFYMLVFVVVFLMPVLCVYLILLFSHPSSQQPQQPQQVRPTPQTGHSRPGTPR